MVEIENDKGNQEYEEIILRNVTETLTREELKGKDLVLIRAPAEFDISCLKGKCFVPNGAVNINLQNENQEDADSSLWNLDAFEVTQSKQLNLMLASGSSKRYCKGQDICNHLEVYRSFNLPPIHYPKVSKKIRKLAKPDDLHARWTPFGSGDSTNCNNYQRDQKRKQNEHNIEEDTTSSKKKKKRKKHVTEEIQEVVEEINHEDSTMKTKKKKKKVENEDAEEDHSNNTPLVKKKKKKTTKTEEESLEESLTAKKKSKKKKKKVKD